MELADRIEALEGAYREIDAEIAVAVGYQLPPPMGNCKARLSLKWPLGSDPLPGGYWLHQLSGASLHRAPKFTADLNAAMMLLPDNTGAVIHIPIGNPPSVALQFSDENHPAPKTVDGWSDYSKGATPALALCAAALRARATAEQEAAQ